MWRMWVWRHPRGEGPAQDRDQPRRCLHVRCPMPARLVNPRDSGGISGRPARRVASLNGHQPKEELVGWEGRDQGQRGGSGPHQNAHATAALGAAAHKPTPSALVPAVGLRLRHNNVLFSTLDVSLLLNGTDTRVVFTLATEVDCERKYTSKFSQINRRA